MGKKKVESLGLDIISMNNLLCSTEKQIQGYDLVVCCADNLDVRRLVYNSDVPWLDLRRKDAWDF